MPPKTRARRTARAQRRRPDPRDGQSWRPDQAWLDRFTAFKQRDHLFRWAIHLERFVNATPQDLERWPHIFLSVKMADYGDPRRVPDEWDRLERRAQAELEEWEREELAAERALSEREREWQEGRAELERLSAELQKQIGKAQSALGAELHTICGGCGVRALALMRNDLEFLSANPHRCPPEAVALYRQAEEAAEIAARLGVGGGLDRFAASAGEEAFEVLREAMDAGHAVPRERGPVAPHNRIMSLEF